MAASTGVRMESKPNTAQSAPYDGMKVLAPTPSRSPAEDPPIPAHFSAEPVHRATFRSVLGRPALRALWVATLISYLGDSFSAMALLILVNHVTHSTVALATVAVAETAPVLFGLLAGALVDRWRYRPVLLAADLARAALVPLYLLFRSSQDLWIVVGIAVGISVASRFFLPASNSLRRTLVRPEEYKITSSIWQATWALSLIAGPLMAGLLISAFASIEMGIGVAFARDSLSFAASAVIIFMFVGREAQAVDAARQDEKRSRPWADLNEGLRTMWASKPLRGVAVLYGVGMLGVGSVFVLVVPYVQREFQGGPLQIGLLETAMACGILVGAVGVGTIVAGKVATGRLMLRGLGNRRRLGGLPGSRARISDGSCASGLNGGHRRHHAIGCGSGSAPRGTSAAPGQGKRRAQHGAKPGEHGINGPGRGAWRCGGSERQFCDRRVSGPAWRGARDASAGPLPEPRAAGARNQARVLRPDERRNAWRSEPSRVTGCMMQVVATKVAGWRVATYLPYQHDVTQQRYSERRNAYIRK